jgi:hypothetical protein
VSPDDHKLAKLREQYPAYRIMRAPWKWIAYKPRSDDEIRAETLEELAEKLKPPAGDGGGAGAPRSTPPAGP